MFRGIKKGLTFLLKNTRNKVTILTVLLSAILILGCSCVFPDNILNYNDIYHYKLEKFKFGKTTLSDFASLAGNPPQKTIKGYKILSIPTANNNKIKKIRIGFKNNKLDWIEFNFKDYFSIVKIVELYGKPLNINTSYNNYLDYFDYGFFNVSTDKNHKLAKSITLFSLPASNTASRKNIFNNIISWKLLKNSDFLNLKPGYTLESDFITKYPDLKPNRLNNMTMYNLNKELQFSQYSKAVLCFDSGLLSWISLTPKNLTLSDTLKVYGTGYKIEKINTIYDYYDFPRFSLVIDKKQKKVLNIGITD